MILWKKFLKDMGPEWPGFEKITVGQSLALTLWLRDFLAEHGDLELGEDQEMSLAPATMTIQDLDRSYKDPAWKFATDEAIRWSKEHNRKLLLVVAGCIAAAVSRLGELTLSYPAGQVVMRGLEEVVDQLRESANE